MVNGVNISNTFNPWRHRWQRRVKNSWLVVEKTKRTAGSICKTMRCNYNYYNYNLVIVAWGLKLIKNVTLIILLLKWVPVTSVQKNINNVWY